MSSNCEIANLTKSYIKTAMLELLAKQSYDKVSITDLVAKAGVSRTAFYRNYSSKEELIYEICYDIIHFSFIDIKEFYSSSLEELQKVFSRLRSKKKEIDIITKASLENMHLLNHRKEIADELIKKNTERKYEEAAFEGALQAIIYKWIYDNMAESDREIALITYKILHKDVN